MSKRIQAEFVMTGAGAGAPVPAGPGHRGTFLRYLPVAIVLAAALWGPAAVSAQIQPCMDGVLFGDVTKFYRAIYDSQYTTMNVYATLDPEEKAMVDCGKDQVGPDINRYQT